MLDAAMRRLIDPPLNAAGRSLARAGAHPNTVTLWGLALGLSSAGLVALGAYWPALAVMLASRLLDGLDGAVARARQITDFGGFLDITSDFLFYGAYPLAFIIADPGNNAIVGAFLLATFYFNGTTFLAFAALAERRALKSDKRGIKSLYFSGGLLEGTETIAFFTAITLWPAIFPPLAAAFAVLTLVTAVWRVIGAWRLFGASF